ncbi:MAG: DUF5063 domain-containing protein [Bacteroidetes bacterium]|jgi:hypothetical protein|nr:DUF5063 domain-containing protein [Bacteroidota bacterium]
MTDFHDAVYQRNIIEFVAVAKEYTIFLETADKFPKPEFVEKLHKVLPFLYFKATLLPDLHNTYDDVIEKYVTEEDYLRIKAITEQKLGQHDAYVEEFNEAFKYSDEPVAASISEDLTDIYQDIKDFIMLYRMGTDEIMNDAVWECRNNFKMYWGQKLVNSLRAIHHLYYSEEDLTDESNKVSQAKEDPDNFDNVDTSSWIISQKQQDYNKDLPEEEE